MVEEVMNAGRLDVLDELYVPSMAAAARRWITLFRESFPDVTMTVVDLVAEHDKVAARFTCSATQRGEWRGHPTTGRRFERVDEVYFFQFRDGRIVHAWGLEDNLDRMRQLGHF
jgi:predicted ester cyclase